MNPDTLTITITSPRPGMSKGILAEAITALLCKEGLVARRGLDINWSVVVEFDERRFQRVLDYNRDHYPKE